MENFCRAKTTVNFFAVMFESLSKSFRFTWHRQQVLSTTLEIQTVYCWNNDSFVRTDLRSAQPGVMHYLVVDHAETGTKSAAIGFSLGWLDLYWHQGGNWLHPLASIHFQAVETSPTHLYQCREAWPAGRNESKRYDRPTRTPLVNCDSNAFQPSIKLLL